MRIEESTALLAALAVNLTRNPNSPKPPAKVTDFMPHYETEDPMSIDSVFRKLGGQEGE